MKTRSSGFTLIEVMVVIAIAGLVSVLLLQMMTVMLRGYDQVGRIQSQLAVESMRSYWFRDTVSSMVASLDVEFGFRGISTRLDGFTDAPLLGRTGQLTAIRWELRDKPGGVSLWYREGSANPMEIAYWPDSRAKFSYRGLNAGWQGSWPPAELNVGILPHRVKLTLEGEAGSREVYTAINTRRTARYDYRDVL